MEIYETKLSGLMILEPKVFDDERGFFYESYNKKVFDEMIGKNINFLQDNHSSSKKGVLRGIHAQKEPFAQGKLVRVIQGTVIDYAIDLRQESRTYLEYFSIELSSDNKKQLWIPEGFGHAFFTISDNAQLAYKATNLYNKESEVTIMWDDPKIGIEWPEEVDTNLISFKDKSGIYV